ncbi:alpha/beta fold hydrolase [Candidatus Woesearchaeota archaeon]|nr:alpha/beta fold hydrolase [Candidatus Woesearchaeota archaeon]
MELLGWLFAKKEKEGELKAVKQLQKESRPIIRVLNKLFDNLDKKKRLLENLLNSDMRNYDKTKAEFLRLNLKILDNLQKLQKLGKLDELFLKHLLILSATRLHSISEELGIKALHRSYKINNVEEAKRRSYAVLKNEEFFNQLLSRTKSEFDNIIKKLSNYKKVLETQIGYVENNNLNSLRFSIDSENKILGNSFGFKKGILIILTRTKQIVGVTNNQIRKESLYSGEKSKKAILIFHSYANTPEENREMAGYFVSRGYTVFAPRFPGHGTTEDEFYNTSTEEVCSFGQRCLDYFYEKNGNHPLIVTGLSLGGMVSLFLSTKKENSDKIKAVIPINAFIKSPLEVKVDKFIPHGSKAIFLAMKKSNLRFMKKSSINLIKARIKNIADSLKSYQFTNFDENFEDKLTKEFLARIDREFQDLLTEQIAESPLNKNDLEKNYLIMRERMERKFRDNYKKKKFAAFDIQDITRLLEYEFYNVMTYKGMVQLNDLSKLLQKEMKKITVPVYIIQSKNDNTVAPISAEIIYQTCDNSPLRQIVMIPNAGHILILENQREYVLKIMLILSLDSVSLSTRHIVFLKNFKYALTIK